MILQLGQYRNTPTEHPSPNVAVARAVWYIVIWACQFWSEITYRVTLATKSLAIKFSMKFLPWLIFLRTLVPVSIGLLFESFHRRVRPSIVN